MATLLVSGGVLLVFANRASAATSSTLTFQARLLQASGALVADGTYNVEFKIYDSPSSGSSLQGVCSTNSSTDDCWWMETRTGADKVTVKNGYVYANLGSVTAFGSSIPWDQELYITMNIGGTGAPSWDGEMTPRFKVTAVPYAFKSATSLNTASTDTNTASTNSGNVSVTSGNATGSTSNSGNITVDTGTATGTTGTISIAATNASALTLGRGGLQTTIAGTALVQGSALTVGTTSVQGSLVLYDGSSNTGTIVVQATSGNYTYTIPTTTANDNFCLETLANCGGGSGVTTVGLLNGGTANANGATITGSTIYLQAASNSYAGLVDTGSQTFAGTKTFNGSIILAASQSLSVTGGNTASRPASPTEGMVYFDTDTKQLVTYANGKWQGDRSTATKIVAASTSSQAIKDSADYVTDGTSDQVEINSALTAAAGGKVYLAEGTYYTDDTISIPNNTTLAGAGLGTDIQFINLAGASKSLITNTDTATGTGVIIRDLHLNGREDLNASGSQYGIKFQGMGSATAPRPGGTITNVGSEHFGGYEILLDNSDNNLITNNYIYDPSGFYIAVNIRNSSDQNIVSANTIKGAYGAVYLNASEANSITGNEFINSVSRDVYGGSNIYRTTVTGNTSSGTATYFFFTNYDADAVTISGNTVNGALSGVYIDTPKNVTVTGNTFNNGQYGVLFYTASDSTISGNTFNNTSAGGVNISGSNRLLISGNQFVNNGGATDNNALLLYNSDGTTIVGNSIFDSSCTTTCYAIDIDSGSNFTYLADNRYGVSAGTDQAIIRDLGNNTRYASQMTPAAILQSGSSLIKANASSTLTGTADPAASTTLPGTGTKFTTELQIGDRITINSETRAVTAIASDTSLTVDIAFSNTAASTITRLPLALQVQSSAGTNVLSVDTTNQTTILRSGNDETTFGAQLIAVPNNFATDFTNTGWNVGTTTQATHNSGNTNALTNTTVAITAGTKYQVNFDLTGTCGTQNDSMIASMGGVQFEYSFDGTHCGGTYSNTYSYLVTATNTNKLTFTPTSAWTGTISNVSIKALTGVINPALSIKNNSGTVTLEVRSSSDNTNAFVGLKSGENNAWGTYNTGFGNYSLQNNTSGSNNTATGAQALNDNTIGWDNSAFGEGALSHNNGDENSAFGSSALSNNYTGASNSAFGAYSLQTNVNGSYNSVLGEAADVLSSALDHATVIGYGAKVGGSNSTVIGRTQTNGINGDAVGINTVLPGATAGTAFQVGTGIYNFGTISQATNTVTGSSTTFTANMVGGTLLYKDGTTATITAFASTTSLTVSVSKTVAASSTYTIVYPGGFNVSTSGVVTSRNLNNSTTAVQFQNASGTGILTVDTTNNNVLLGSGTSLTVTGGNTASRPGSPTEGMVYYDTDTKQLVTYSNGKWQGDRSTASKIVAASNSSQTAKDSADYVANGENSVGSGTGTIDGDQIEINAALTAVGSAGGGTVYLMPGTYTIDASISIPNNVTLAGSGASTLVQYGNFGATLTNLNAIVNTDTTTGTNVTVRDFQLDGRSSINTNGTIYGFQLTNLGGTSPVTPGITITHMTMLNFRNGLIAATSMNNSIFTENYVKNVGDVVITSNSTHNAFSNNQFVSVGNVFYYSNDFNNNMINGNVAQDVGYFMDMGRMTGTVITNNTITGTQYLGIRINGLSTDRNIISSNFISGGYQGIALESGATVVSGNYLKDILGEGIEVYSDGNSVTDNIIENAGDTTDNEAIAVYGDSDNNVITGNSISDSSCTTTCYAIDVFAVAADNTYLANNRLINGTINNAGTGTIFGGQTLSSTSDFLFRGSNSATAFAVQTSAGTSVFNVNTATAGVTVSGTLAVTGTSTYTGLATFNGGATVATGQNLTVNGDVFTDLTGSGLTVSGNALTVDSTSATGFFRNGGNAFTANSVLGNTGNYSLSLITNNTTALSVDTSQNVAFTGNLTVAASKSLRITGGNTASRPASPTEGMVYFDTDTKQLLTYANGKWQGDRSTATKIVAASNSSQAEKDAADYVANGNTGAANDGDQIEINAALTAAAGGKVYLLEGTYVADATILIPDNTTLAGAGRGTNIELADLDATDNLIENSNAVNGTGVVIRDLKLDGRDDLNTAGVQRGIYLLNMGDASASIPGAQILNLVVEDFRSEAIELSASEASKISNNTIQGSLYGVYLLTAASNTISGNTVQNNDYIGIYSDTSSSNNISGNIIQANLDSGIFIYSSTNTTVSSNTVQGNAFIGIALSLSSGSSIVGNTSQGNTSRGIYVSSSSNNVISGNTIFDNSGAAANDGIYLTNADNNTITSNDITDSSCTTSCYAINISNVGSDNNYLADNRYSVTAGTDQAKINDAGTGTRYASQISAAAILQSGSSLIKANATSVLTGSIDPAASTTVPGVSTKFTTELQVGDRITVSGETRTVTAIASDTSLTVDTAFSNNANDTSPDRLPASLKITDSTGATQMLIKDNGDLEVDGTTLSVDASNNKVTVGGSNGLTVSNNAEFGAADTTLGVAIGAGSNGSEIKLRNSGVSHFSLSNTGNLFTIGTASSNANLGSSVTPYLTINGSTGALNVASAATFGSTLVVQGASITSGTTSQAGSLIVSDGSSSTVTFKTATQVAATNYDITIPAITANDTVCLLTLANCSSSNLLTDSGTFTYLTSTTDDFVLGASTTASAALFADVSAGSLRVGDSSALAGTLFIADGSSNTVGITASGVGSDYTLTLPTSVGSASDCLKNSGTAGILVFTACGSGGSLFTDAGTFTYLTSTTDDLIVGDSTTAAASLFVDESAGTVRIGDTSTLAGTLFVADGSSNTVGITASGVGTDYTLTLPTSVGSASQCIKNSGTAGILTFANCNNGSGSGGAVTLDDAYEAGNTLGTSDARDVLFDLTDTATDSNFFVSIQGTGNTFAVRDGTTNVLTVTDGGNTTIKANGGSNIALTVDNGTSSGSIFVAKDNGTAVFTIADGGAITATNTLIVQGASASIGATGLAGTLYVSDGSSNTVGLTASGVASDFTLTLPTSVGSASDCLKNSGTAGILTFASCSGGAGDSITVNSSAATDANFLNTTATASVAGTTFSLNTASSPDDITLTISDASGSVAGIVTANPQTLGGAKTFSSLITGSAGLDVTGATTNINASSNFATNINTGSSTGAITIGNAAAGAIALQSGSTVGITAGTTFALSSTNLNVSTAGVVTLAGNQTSDITTASAASASNIGIQPGLSTGATSTGGQIFITGGNDSGTTIATGGGVTINGGDANGASGNRTGGSISIDAGTGANSNGIISLGASNATNLLVGNSLSTTTIFGNLGQQDGAISLLGNAASSISTSTGDLSIDSGSTLNLGVSSASAVTIGKTGITTTNSGALTVAQLLTVQGGTATLGTSGVAGILSVSDGSSNVVNLTASGVGTNFTLTLPSTIGSANQCLQNSGTAGILTFASCGGGSLFTDGGTFTYLTSTTDDLVIGDNTVAGASLYVDESAGSTTFGNSGLAGSLILSDGSSNTVTLTAGGVGTNYSLTLPTAAGGTSQCLQTDASVATQLVFAACGAGGSGVTTVGTFSGTPQTDGASISGSTITFGPASGTVPGMVSTSAQTFAGDKTFTGNIIQKADSATAINLQDATGTYNNLTFDSSSGQNHLKVFNASGTRTAYVDIYYNNTLGAAVFASSSGTTQIGAGTGSGGDINLLVSNEPDKLSVAKTGTLTGAYTGTDFNFTRNLTIGTYAANGNILKIEDNTSIASGSIAPNVLYINQGNTSATGNLILAQTGGATDIFKVTTAGAITVKAGGSLTGAGAFTVDAGASSALNIGTTNATSIVVGGNTSATLTEKIANSSTSAYSMQTAGGTSFITADTTNSRLTIGASDTTGTLLILDTKTDSADPTGVNGGMYYNSNSGRFRCYENGAWADCLGYRHLITLGSDSASTASTACQNVSGATFSLTSGVTYRFHATIVHTGTATTIGVGYGVSGPASPTLFSMVQTTASTSSATQTASQSALSTCTASSASFATTGSIDRIDGIITPSSSGTFQLLFSPETAVANGVVIKAGSTLEWW